jgi:BNR-Asp box repeat
MKLNLLVAACTTTFLLAACGGDGKFGNDGSNGLTTRMLASKESAGAHCALGGKLIQAGLDASGNGVLEAGEVTSTSFVCNAAPGGGNLQWVRVTDTQVQALPNTGYLADHVDQVTITLPANPTSGDVIRVSGMGAGGWKIAQNAGQTIQTTSLAGGAIGQSWVPGGPAREWTAVASSEDGTKLVAAPESGSLYTSVDAGLHWTDRPFANTAQWTAVASSADGTRLVAAPLAEGVIYTSTDSGENWTPHNVGSTTGGTFWNGVASSAEGRNLVAVGGGGIYTSSDFGITWATSGTRGAYSVASSADGSRLVSVQTDNKLYTSSDAGSTWIERAPEGDWSSVASSADGTRLVATQVPGRIHISTDSGVTWKPQGDDKFWVSVASSADGTRLAAIPFFGQIHISTDSGVSWSPQGVNASWAVAMSGDGTRLFAAKEKENGLDDGRLYTSAPVPAASTSAGVAGYISARPYDSIELLFEGNGKFTVLSSTGTFEVR